ncbi:MAG: efflux RND transporter permease subunit, partial [bacterium]
PAQAPMTRAIDFLVENRLIALILAGLLTLAGLYVVPFPIDTDLPRDPVPVDAIPDIGENQQIVFTRWPGRSPRDVEDQVTYPLTVALLGLPGVKGVRARSAFGFSSVYVIFQDDVEFYWSRSRLLEKLSALPPDTLPEGVRPELGPDATGLGQVFWYTLEGEGFDRQELREIQDFYVRYALQSVEGVAEVAGVGGQVIGWQVEVDPDLLQHYGLSLAQVFNAVRQANQDVGAGTLEINKVEYVIRGVGLIRTPEDLADVVIVAPDHVPVTVGQAARWWPGPAAARGPSTRRGRRPSAGW